MLFSSWFLQSFILLSSSAFAQEEIKLDNHLSTFVSRPEIKAPKWDIKKNNHDKVSPGYWFVSPYHQLKPFDASGQKWDPCEIGAHIYDNNGDLVWSGACLYDNRNVFDFKLNRLNGKDYPSLLVTTGPHNKKVGSGIVLNDNFEEKFQVQIHENEGGFNMHDFNIVDGGKHVLALTWEAAESPPEAQPPIGLPEKKSWVYANGFREFDLETGSERFAWHSLDQVPQNESTFKWPDHIFDRGPGWDYIHMNSADKFDNGDYLISSRYMNCIYRINGKNGDIVWRFGGPLSDFQLDGFNFSRQHHARILETNSTHIQLSFLDNAAGEMPSDLVPSYPFSRGMFVSLDLENWKASLVKHYDRPDGRLTRRRGSVQLLENGNVFICWSEGGYQSEHTPDGEVVMEAQFSTNRYSTYRGYKYNFTSNPSEPPALVASAYGATEDTLTTVTYVSWNGATEVRSWNFYERKTRDGNETLIGTAPKTGFETMFMYDGYAGFVVAEALDADGNAIGRSVVRKTNVPANWKAAGWQEENRPQPEDPDAIPEEEEEDEEDAEESIWDVGLDGFVIILLIALACCSFLLFIVWLIRRRAFVKYIQVPEDDMVMGSNAKLEQLSSVVVESRRSVSDRDQLLREEKSSREDV